MSEPITFIGSLAPILSAIKVTGDGGGMRITIDIPESQMGNALSLLTMREQLLEITVDIHHDNGPTTTAPKRTTAKRRK